MFKYLFQNSVKIYIHIVKALVVKCHVQIWELDHKEGWEPKNWLWCWRRLENSLDSKESKPINTKGNQPRIFIGSIDIETEASIFWPPDAKSRLIGKAPDAGKGWGQQEKGVTEDEMVGWHRWLNGHEFEQAPVDTYDREVWHVAWNCKESDMV